MITVSALWKLTYPEAHAGILVMRNASNPPMHAELDDRKKLLQDQIRARFAGQERRAIEALEPMQAYDTYYKRFKKSYHVQGQLESVAFKNRDIPSVAALVEAMFMAEVQNLLLTAGHDWDKLRLPITVSVAEGNESYTMLRGQPQTLKAGDMIMTDRDGVISCVLYGPDQRTQITATTQHVLFMVYAVPGISEGAIREHLRDIQENVRLVSPAAEVALLEVYGA